MSASKIQHKQLKPASGESNAQREGIEIPNMANTLEKLDETIESGSSSPPSATIRRRRRRRRRRRSQRVDDSNVQEDLEKSLASVQLDDNSSDQGGVRISELDLQPVATPKNGHNKPAVLEGKQEKSVAFDESRCEQEAPHHQENSVHSVATNALGQGDSRLQTPKVQKPKPQTPRRATPKSPAPKHQTQTPAKTPRPLPRGLETPDIPRSQLRRPFSSQGSPARLQGQTNASQRFRDRLSGSQQLETPSKQTPRRFNNSEKKSGNTGIQGSAGKSGLTTPFTASPSARRHPRAPRQRMESHGQQQSPSFQIAQRPAELIDPAENTEHIKHIEYVKSAKAPSATEEWLTMQETTGPWNPVAVTTVTRPQDHRPS
ncbi:hypothetical protein TWF730_009452 [Orbilia blumenaviensis]|uniref:Uncharacterized protein n=1 Tax=Orbilia blumenaviensis TaxID=1796055 RepID=A0AAV9UZ31_9PEZI